MAVILVKPLNSYSFHKKEYSLYINRESTENFCENTSNENNFWNKLIMKPKKKKKKNVLKIKSEKLLTSEALPHSQGL